MADFSIELVKEQSRLAGLIDRLCSLTVIALDIETINWWNRHRELIALVQIAYRTGGQAKVVVIDALAELDLEPLRRPLELPTITKIIHNAVFDAGRLAKHLEFQVTPIFDTMAAARRSGERRYSLQAQAEIHLGLLLDKGSRRSDWSRRPLETKQLHYAALDAFSTLLLYENQRERKLNGTFQLKGAAESSQAMLPLDDITGQKVLLAAAATDISIAATAETASPVVQTEKESSLKSEKPEFTLPEIALLGIITELPTRYHPDGLAVSVGSKARVGLAGWIVDRTLGADADLDEESAKLAIADLCERNLVRITATRRLEATAEGERLWNQSKSRGY